MPERVRENVLLGPESDLNLKCQPMWAFIYVVYLLGHMIVIYRLTNGYCEWMEMEVTASQFHSPERPPFQIFYLE